MKNFFKYLLLIFLFSLWGIILTNKNETRQAVQEVKTAAQKKLGIDQPCGKPLEYAIGNVDPKFNLSKDSLEKLAVEAANVWNGAEGKTLLMYNPAATFKINLVYDDRQEASTAATQLEQDLQSLEATNNTLKNQYDSLNATYKEKIDAYNKDVAGYKSDLDKYNAEVNDWNSQGGVDSGKYDKLKKEQNNLQDEYRQISQERKEIDDLVSRTNGVARKENQVVNNYNSTVSTYKNQYGGAHEFEKGVFDGQEIDIYQFKEISDLRLTLVHELGHYLGMQHVENSKSIMYYLIGDQDMSQPTLTKEDLDELNKICKIN